MDEKIESLIGTMKVMTRDNLGVVINPISLDDGVLTIEYFEGENEDCPECLMSPDSFQDMLKSCLLYTSPSPRDS